MGYRPQFVDPLPEKKFLGTPLLNPNPASSQPHNTHKNIPTAVYTAPPDDEQ
jgi:hypothetical protein